MTRQEIALEPWFAERGWITQYLVKPGMPWKFWRLDFALVDQQLNVEIDGSAHRKPDRIERDQKRDARMNELGWRVLRIPAEFVDDDYDGAIATIEDWISSSRR